MRVLNLVTNERATFYRHQVDSLKRAGVECTTLAVPGRSTDGVFDGRGPADYLRFYPPVLRHSFGDYDLVHANYGLTAPFALAQPNLPVVLSLWGSDLFGRYGPVSRLCALWCDSVVVMSDDMASALDAPCEVIPHGVDLERFRPRPRAEARDELGWCDDAEHVLFPYSPTQPVKDYPRARRIVDLARARVDARIELQTVSGVPHDRMSTYMNAATALLMTSKYEGSPNAVKEALACDLPVVSTDVGDVRKRIDGVSPSFVGTNDDELVEGLATVLSVGSRSNGRECVEALSVERTGERLRAIYESVAEV